MQQRVKPPKYLVCLIRNAEGRKNDVAGFLSGNKLFNESSLHLTIYDANWAGHLMQKVLLKICVCWFFCHEAIAEQVIYQWRDSNNVLHVSQLPPANVDYQTIVLGSKAAAPAVAATEPLASKASANYLQSCTKAKDNLRILQQDLPVYLDLEDGNRELLDDVKRDEQRLLAEKQIRFYCDKPTEPKR